jgi:hypothetical protein
MSDYSYVFGWFDREIKSVFDVDVFAHSFNKREGYVQIHKEMVDLIVVRVEDLLTLLSTHIASFLDHELELIMGRQRKKSDPAYSEVKNRLTLSREACEKIYQSRFVQHLYSTDMI